MYFFCSSELRNIACFNDMFTLASTTKTLPTMLQKFNCIKLSFSFHTSKGLYPPLGTFGKVARPCHTMILPPDCFGC